MYDLEIIEVNGNIARVKYRTRGISSFCGRTIEMEFIHFETINLCILEKYQKNTGKRFLK